MLFGVLIGVGVLGVGLTLAATRWSRVVQREREAELLFRGEAIVRAIERYQQGRPGAFPETLEELVEGRYLRRAWTDPLTRGPFRLLRAAERAAAAPPRPAPTPTNPLGEEAEIGAAPHPTDGPGAADGSAGGIVGVASTSELLSFRAYDGSRRYSEWRFEASTAGAGARAGSRSERPR